MIKEIPMNNNAKKNGKTNRKTKEKFIYRTVIVTAKLDSNALNVLTEIEKYYKEMLVELVKYAIDKRIVNYKQLCREKARELKDKYRGLPTHYINTVIKDAARQASEFLSIKEKGKVYTDYPEIKNVTIWLDDHLWKLEGYTRLRISTHRGHVELEIEPHKHYWKYRNSKNWELVKECQIKIDRKNKRLLVYLKFRKQRVSEAYISQNLSFISVDVNVNNITTLIGKAHMSNADKNNNIKVQIDGKVYLFETDIEEIINGYYHRRKLIQEKYDKLFGICSREKKKPMKKLKEKQKKKDIIYKIANIIVREAIKRNAIIVIENLGKNAGQSMIEDVKDKQLRNMLIQAAFNSTLKAIEMKAKEHGVPVIKVNPRYTSKLCPIHHAEIEYNKDRYGVCKVGGETWHRDVAAVYNIALRYLSKLKSDSMTRFNENSNSMKLQLDPNFKPNEPIIIKRELWARWKSLVGIL